MSGVTLAVGLGSAAAGMYGASKQADAQRDAADDVAEANRLAGQMTRNQWLQNQATQMPWLAAGNKGLNALLVGLGLSTPEQVMSMAPLQNDATFDSEAFFKAHPVTNGGESLQDIVRQWGITPYEYWRDYGQSQGMDFTYKPGYGPEDMAGMYGGGGTAGASGLPGYGDLNKRFTIDDFNANVDPAYEWRKQQGIDSLVARGVANGKPWDVLKGQGSGNMGTALIDYGQNAASQEYQNAFNRWNQQQTQAYNRLANMAGLGQTVAEYLGNQGAQAADKIGSSYVNAANTLASGQVGAANTWASGYNNAANKGMGALEASLNKLQNPRYSNDDLNRLFKNWQTEQNYQSAYDNIDWGLAADEQKAWGY